MRKYLIILFALCLIISACSVETGTELQTLPAINTLAPQSAGGNSITEIEKAEIPDNALSSENIIYLGAFRLPEDGEIEEDMFAYGGEALCYNPDNDTLFITGHNWYTYVAEISIPESIISKNVAELNQSIKLKGFIDIKGKLFDKWTMEIPRVGMEIIDHKLFFCFGEHYEEDTSLGTHGYTELDLAKASKVCIAGDYLYATNDYMFSVPEEYIEYLGGNDLLTGRFRDGGWSGKGPSLIAVSTQNIISAENHERIPAVPLIKYDDSFNGDTGSKMNNYSHADSWTGGAFVQCDTGSAVLFIGTHGYGQTWYGFSNGVVYPTDGDENAIYPEVPEYPHDERGWWNDDFKACITFYSTADLIEVFNGQMSASEIQPYEFADLSQYMLINRDETAMQYLGAAAYDREGGRLFILELMADNDKPVVHVFTFE